MSSPLSVDPDAQRHDAASYLPEYAAQRDIYHDRDNGPVPDSKSSRLFAAVVVCAVIFAAWKTGHMNDLLIVVGLLGVAAFLLVKALVTPFVEAASQHQRAGLNGVA